MSIYIYMILGFNLCESRDLLGVHFVLFGNFKGSHYVCAQCRCNYGFYPNGPNCGYKHTKLHGPPPPVEDILEILKTPEASNNNYRYGQILGKPNSVALCLSEGISRFPTSVLSDLFGPS